MLKAYLTNILVFSCFLGTAQVNFVWQEERDSVSLDQLISKSISSRVLDNETIKRMWRQHSIDNNLNPEINLNERRSITLAFYLDEANKVSTVTYSMSSFRFTQDGGTRLTFPKEAVLSVIDSLGLQPRIHDFVNYLDNGGFLFRSKRYVFTLGRIFEKLNTSGIKKWESIQNSTRPDTVKKLSFSNFKLRKVPEDLGRFENLETLDLSGNYFSEIPKSVFKLKKLKMLDLSKNGLSANSFHITRNKSLGTINIQNNSFRTLPKKLKKLKKLDFLIAGRNSLDKVESYKFQKLKRLKNLNLYNASISNIPPKLFKIKGLEELDLYYNFIKVIKGDVSQWSQLKTLALSYNGLWKLPDELYELQSLKTLYAHHNKLEKVPSLPISLELLDIGYNDFQEFPFAISSLRNLKELDYNGNNLDKPIRNDYLPENLKILFVSANPLFNIDSLKSESEAFLLDLQKRNIDVR